MDTGSVYRRSMPISFSKPGDCGKIVRISGNGKLKKHLEEMGFTSGADIRTVSDLKGSKILSIRGAKIAVDHSLASKIIFCPE